MYEFIIPSETWCFNWLWYGLSRKHASFTESVKTPLLGTASLSPSTRHPILLLSLLVCLLLHLFVFSWNILGHWCFGENPVLTVGSKPNLSSWSLIQQLSACSITLYGHETASATRLHSIYLYLCVCVRVRMHVYACKGQQLVDGICSCGTIKGSQRGGGRVSGQHPRPLCIPAHTQLTL